ncbi:phosphatidylserine decarboxylase proenzyme, mitochondrial [Chrysoperla carnea]|uniref:phosphatidylserine decarboxylase proenzyme, mitochondrial n=1 Tax=Chrysoperla carnea TaxID=189513 RepID=UPI001D07CEB6|nr:phosphatidylserine decarboxylase proenzyme, mitochondrial [Chrysoperla carnea]
MEGHHILLSRNTQQLLQTTVKYIFKGRFQIENVRFRTTLHNKSIITPKGIKYRKVFYITIPIGTGFYGYNYWRTTRQNQCATQFEVRCYCALPLRAMSRWWGWIADIELPYVLRPWLYGFYASTFGVNLMEAKTTDLRAYSTLSDFFCRELKEDARQIDQNSSLVSPCDGVVLNCSLAENGVVEQVKGVNYNLNKFLGENNYYSDENPLTPDKHLLHNKNNKLYQCTIYLAPGDYHRFHSPTDWQPGQRKHFSGELLSVNPGIASWIPDLFVLNERAVYTGTWKHGFFSMTAVGATNVGKIRVFFDDCLTTNRKQKDEKIHHDFNHPIQLKKGDLFGEFRMGSTIVLIFEAPPDFEFNIAAGTKIRMGESLENFNDKNCNTAHNLQNAHKIVDVRTR